MKKNFILVAFLLILLAVILGAWGLVKNTEDFQSLHHELIEVTSPLLGDIISNPLVVEGEARGYWFFEASFPLILTDWDGRIIAEGYATAETNWMTEDFVPFTGVLEFEEPEDSGHFSDWGHLIFKKANASGLPEHDDAYEIRIRFR